MGKKFLIQDHIPKLINILSSILTGGAFLFLTIPFLLRDELLFFRGILLKKAIIISPALFIIAIFLDKLSSKVSTLGITVSDNKLTFHRFFTTKTLLFSNIKKFEYKKKFGLSKNGIIYSNNDNFNINFLISNLPDLISIIRKQMNLSGCSKGYTPENIADFDLTARYRELLSQILSISITPIFRVMLFTIILNLIVVTYFWNFYLIINLAWLVQSLFFPAAAFLASYTILRHQAKKQIQKKPTNMSLPDYSKIFYFVSLPIVALFLIEGVMFRRFFINYFDL